MQPGAHISPLQKPHGGRVVPGQPLHGPILKSLRRRDAGYLILLLQLSLLNAVRAGTVVAWGAGATNGTYDPNFGQAAVPHGLSNVVAIAAGSMISLALKSDGKVVAWGYNNYGVTNVPANCTNVVTIAAGGDFSNPGGESLAMRLDGGLVSWGRGNRAVPAGISNVVALSVGRENFLALRKDGTVLGWGENGWGQTNVPATATNVVAIAAGAMHCLALIRDGTVVGWGYNYFGETTGVSTYPVSVTNGFVALGGVRLSNVVAIAAGEYHSVALKDDGTVIVWGDNSYGQRNVPAGLSNVVAIASGGSEGANHCLALRGDGTVVAWGWDAYGQTNVPAGLSNVVAISAGGGHSLALVGDGPPIIQVRLNSSQWSGGRFSVLAPAESGRVYGLEYKETLATGQWHPLPLAAGAAPTLTLSDSTATNSSRVYRVRRW